MYINDANGCGISETIEVSVIFFQRFFTPNNDGINDIWGMFDTYTAPGLINLENGGYLFARNSKTKNFFMKQVFIEQFKTQQYAELLKCKSLGLL